ncbi:MAG: exodeoxyribonuclease VII small subunit [Eubacteriales bacterium]
MSEQQSLSFEAAMKRLGEVVKLLGDGKTALEDSLKLFEEGISLVSFCNEQLSRAEARVAKLVQGQDGMTEVPFQ